MRAPARCKGVNTGAVACELKGFAALQLHGTKVAIRYICLKLPRMKTPLVQRHYRLEKFAGKGGWTFALIPEVPPDPHAWFGWISVKGRIDDVELPRCKLMPKGNGQLFLPVNTAMRKKLKKQAGDEVLITLYRDDEPPVLPQEILDCFELEPPEVYARYLSLSADEQHALLKPVLEARQSGTKEARIRRMLDLLREPH